MAKRSKRSGVGTAQKMGRYIDAGTSKVSTTVTTFLANFDTAELVAALKHQAQTAGRAAGQKVGIVDAPGRRKKRKKMANKTAVKKTAKKTAMKRRKTKRK